MSGYANKIACSRILSCSMPVVHFFNARLYSQNFISCRNSFVKDKSDLDHL